MIDGNGEVLSLPEIIELARIADGELGVWIHRQLGDPPAAEVHGNLRRLAAARRMSLLFTARRDGWTKVSEIRVGELGAAVRRAMDEPPGI